MLSGRNEGSKDEHDLTGPKVYSRKPSKGLQNSNLLEEPIVNSGSDNHTGSSRDFVGKGGLFMMQENKVRINLSTGSKHESLELKKKLERERDLIRSLMRKIEANEGKRNVQKVDDVGPPRMSKPLNQLSVSVCENTKTGVDSVEKEKRTPKANKFYGNSDFLLAKDKLSYKKSKPNVKKDNFPNQVMKSCSALLERLMKHKHGWVFRKPVDTVTLGLHDYFEIIKKPMDLGTVKERLTRNLYKSPIEFAQDVRLTFQNAMTYNPKGQDVYVMAELLSKMFEEKWGLIESELKNTVDIEVGSTKTLSRKNNAQQPHMKKAAMNMNIGQAGKINVSKKPKAKDPNKRDMSYDEKQKLSVNLQNLPSEKLENVVEIIKKRNPTVSQQDDEIEVDIDTFDTETLWELDRFIANYKKSVSKNKRKAEIVSHLSIGPTNNEEKITTSSVTEIPKGSKIDELKIFAPWIEVEEAKGNDVNKGASQSSSSSDSGSSSSDSDGESSKDGSDGGHSPKN